MVSATQRSASAGFTFLAQHSEIALRAREAARAASARAQSLIAASRSLDESAFAVALLDRPSERPLDTQVETP